MRCHGRGGNRWSQRGGGRAYELADADSSGESTGHSRSGAHAVSDPLEAAIILAQGLAESGQRAGGAAALSPLTPGLVAAGLALGDNALAYSAIRQSIDAPLWAADPTIDALAKILPEPVGGTDGVHESDNGQDGQLINFRDDVLWAATNAIRTPIGDALGVSPSINENPQAIVGAGLLQSGERFVLSTTGAPLGLIPIAQAIASGSEEELYVAIRQYIDGPLYVVDPTIDALATVLPVPVGGTDGVHESDDGRDGQLINFRDDVLWRTTSAIRTPIANVLGVDPNLDKDDLESDSFRSTGIAAVVGKNNRVLGSTECRQVHGRLDQGRGRQRQPEARPHGGQDVKRSGQGVVRTNRSGRKEGRRPKGHRRLTI